VPTPQQNVSSFERNTRLEAFSDGVFAIVITLLVIELNLPALGHDSTDRELFSALWQVRHKLVAYFLCFLFIGQLWVAHTNFLRLLVRTDQVLLWLNNALLMFTSLFPFVAEVVGDHPGNPGSVALFGALFFATGIAFGAMGVYSGRARLLHTAAMAGSVQRGNRIATWIGVGSLLPLALAWYSPPLALGCYFALIIAYIRLQRLFLIEL
jgi:uncharacterized membrane protein